MGRMLCHADVPFNSFDDCPQGTPGVVAIQRSGHDSTCHAPPQVTSCSRLPAAHASAGNCQRSLWKSAARYGTIARVCIPVCLVCTSCPSFPRSHSLMSGAPDVRWCGVGLYAAVVVLWCLLAPLGAAAEQFTGK